MVRAAVKVFACTLALAPREKPSKKSATNSDCRSPTSRVRTLVSTTAALRPPKSTATTPSVSSIGITKYPARSIPRFRTQRRRKRLAQRNADIFNRMVLVDIQIAQALKSRSKAPCLATSSIM